MDLTATGSHVPRLSVVVPAHNEEHHLPLGLVDRYFFDFNG
jgi:hypothetical protein